jgi:SAM-dependent methyltransferase
MNGHGRSQSTHLPRSTGGGGQVINPFDNEPAARRYAGARPFYHAVALELAASQLGLGRVPVAVDLGCGTGLSARALRERADHVIALDASAAMLAAAEPLRGVRYAVARSEQLPLPGSVAGLATAGAAFHWFDQSRALAELARVLRVGAALVVYGDFFHGRLAGRPAFTGWLQDSYLPAFPGPARHAYFDARAAERAGFARPDYAEGELQIPLTCEQLADYLMSQSNAAVAIESGRVTAAGLRHQILTEIGRFFPVGGTAAAVFGVRVWTTVRRR